MNLTAARIFLAFVGMAYVGLGLWCAVDPKTTASAVGFELTNTQGQSEFLTVYGGLEVGLGLLFLWPLIRRDEVAFPLFACLLIHTNLVLFRTVGFFAFEGFESTTYVLAAIEWGILLASTGFYFGVSSQTASRN